MIICSFFRVKKYLNQQGEDIENGKGIGQRVINGSVLSIDTSLLFHQRVSPEY
jgi:hypothetical protein